MTETVERRNPALLRIVAVYTLVTVPLALGVAALGSALAVLLTSGFSVLTPSQLGRWFVISLLACIGGTLLIALRVWLVRRVFRKGVSVSGTVTYVTPDGGITIFGRTWRKPNRMLRCSFEYRWEGRRYGASNVFESMVLDADLAVGDSVRVALDPSRPRSACLELLYLPNPDTPNSADAAGETDADDR
jgi:hypothetical protein